MDNRSFPAWARSAPKPLSTFPQPRSSTDTQQVTSLFAESIHRSIHRTLALHPRGWRDRSVLSCWPWAPVRRSTCPPSLPSPLPSGQQPSAHTRRLSDEVSDNRHGHRRTSADTHGRSAAGHTRCDARSPRRNLASGRRSRPTGVDFVRSQMLHGGFGYGSPSVGMLLSCRPP